LYENLTSNILETLSIKFLLPEKKKSGKNIKDLQLFMVILPCHINLIKVIEDKKEE